MSVFEQLTAMEQLLTELLEEPDVEALRARLRSGPFPERQDGKAYSPDFPFEEFTIGKLLNVAALADRLQKQTHERIPRPASSRVFVGQRVLSATHEQATSATT